MLGITSSGSKTADAAIYARECYLHSVVLIGGSDAADVIIYDNPSAASGTKLTRVKVAALTTVILTFNNPVVALSGLYADVTGTSPEYYVYYST